MHGSSRVPMITVTVLKNSFQTSPIGFLKNLLMRHFGRHHNSTMMTHTCDFFLVNFKFVGFTAEFFKNCNSSELAQFFLFFTAVLPTN